MNLKNLLCLIISILIPVTTSAITPFHLDRCEIALGSLAVAAKTYLDQSAQFLAASEANKNLAIEFASKMKLYAELWKNFEGFTEAIKVAPDTDKNGFH